MIRVIHKDCGKVAFYFRERLKAGDILKSSNVVLIDESLLYQIPYNMWFMSQKISTKHI